MNTKHNHTKTLKDLLLSTKESFGSSNVFIYKDSENGVVNISAEQFLQDVVSFGTALYELGIKNKHVALVGENSYKWIVAYYAIAGSGNVVVPIDPALPVDEITSLIKKGECVSVVYSEKHDAVADKILYGSDHSVEYLISMKDEKNSSKKHIDFSDMLTSGNDRIKSGNREFFNNEVDPKKLAVILFTSGTTGVSKGVMLSHENIIENTIEYSDKIKVVPSLLILPIHHIFGIVVAVHVHVLQGKTIFIGSGVANLFTEIKIAQPKMIVSVPAFVGMFCKMLYDAAKNSSKKNEFEKLIHFCKVNNKSLEEKRELFKPYHNVLGGELELIYAGGAPLDESLAKAFRDVGIEVLQGYGMSETSPVITTNTHSEQRANSVGRKLPWCDLKIDAPNEHGEGELLVKGKCVMLGYYKDETATNDAFSLIDGEKWFRTGDMAKIDEDGFLFLTGRKKNLIILSNGKNIYPEELEMALGKISSIKEVVAFQDYERNVIAAEIYLNPDFVKEHGDVEAQKQVNSKVSELNERLPSFKRIAYVLFRDKEFDKTTKKSIKRSSLSVHIQKKETVKVDLNETQERLVKIWSDVLGKQIEDVNDSFFVVGGDSLTSIALLCGIEEKFNLKLDAAVIYKYDTIRMLAEYIDSKAEGGINNEYSYEQEIKERLNAIKFSSPEASKSEDPGNILLTGCTGYLGSHILYCLLTQTNHTVYCLIRSEDKYNQIMSYYFDSMIEECYKSRIKLVVGDITKGHLGLSEEIYESMAKDVSSVIHAAADVRHYGHWKYFEATNIYGTLNIVEFCGLSGAKLNHISTMWISGKDIVSQKNNEVLFDETMFEIGQNYMENVYVHSKFIAEKIVFAAEEKGLSANIFRMGNLTERYSDGKIQINISENGFYMRAKGIEKLGMLPYEFKYMLTDITPIDKAAEAVVKLFTSTGNNTYHIFNPDEMDMFDYLETKSIDIKPVSRNEFIDKLEQMSKDDIHANVLKFYTHEIERASSLGKITFTNKKTQSRLLELDFSW